MNAVRLARYDDLTDQQWHAIRSRGIGGSDIAAIAGMNPWKTPLQVWAEKVGLEPPEPANERMRWGQRLEEVIAQEFAERHPDWRVRRVGAVLRHPKADIFLANIDRLVTIERGRQAVLEIKTTDARHASRWQDGPPPWVVAQAQWYLGVTGLQVAYVAALIGGNRYVEYELPRDNALIEHLQAAAHDFWFRHVVTGEPPEPSGSEADTETLKRLYPEAIEPSVMLDASEAEPRLAQLRDARRRLAEAEAEVRRLEQWFQAHLGNAEVGLVRGEPVVRWATVTTSRLDTKALERDYPDIAARYRREATYRRFTLLGEEG